ncbi:DnaJ family domain-containing protein [Oceanobacillus damuensis]|uniref:DnaJ family domain-containing protein n=1 Tax=Oceanobacillus damuensis TaxID=937928 RepID=UPI000832B335|nr:DnaJ family domain-containing protein [Oceanobacillus damuensis]
MDKEYNDLIGDILEASGEKDNVPLKGKGKPLPKGYVERDVFQNFQKIAKDAGYLPYWLKLQKEISALVYKARTEKDIKKINLKIKEYNGVCPSSMQKLPVDFYELEKAKEIW